MKKSFSRQPLPSDTAVLITMAAATLVAYCLVSGRYGYFRDEFYYFACGEHLDWGYVDHPPFVALMAFLTRRILGESLLAIRFVPGLAESVAVLLTGLIARELGGGRFAQIIAALSAMMAPVFLIIGHIFSMNAFDHLFWALGVYVIVLVLKYDRPRLWLLFGLIAGAGLMNKYSMGFMGLGLVAGLVLTPARKYLLSEWLWLGGALATLIFLPHVLWEIRHGFPTREFVENATRYKIAPLSPLGFVGESALQMHPFTLPLWLAGLWFYLFSETGRKYRLLGWIYVSVLALFLLTKAKPYYLAPAYFMLLAAGAVAVEDFIRRRNLEWLKAVTAAGLVTGGLVLLPIALPVLPVETFIRYQAFLRIPVESGEKHRMGKLPQMYGDMFGWEEMVAAVANVYNRLTPEEKARCIIFASNYGEAGAIDFLGKKYGLPKAASGHNNYWLWGPGNYDADMAITVGESREDVGKTFDEAELAAVIKHEYAMPYESDLPVFICQKPRTPLREVWPRIRHYI